MIAALIGSVVLSQVPDVVTREFVVHHIERQGKIETLAANMLGLEVFEQSQELGLDPLLVLAVMRVESNFDPDAVSPVGAKGIMQVMPKTEKWVLDRFLPEAIHLGWRDPVSNATVGMAYLGYLFRKYSGNLERVLVAYNSGPGYVDTTLKTTGKLPAERMLYSLLVKKELRLLRAELEKELADARERSTMDGADPRFGDWIDSGDCWARLSGPVADLARRQG